ncbi:AGAP004772-PA-like protein [Anopheles sinensis]|uniref:AGAP004772-PA-like protein n=1 Tax=Anopheles sinensis TaxID=74873 RepID=A0A084VZR1_ANOSI|nr:AGAP004772-PA-like protein [Anopheles sinensis]
MEAQIALVQELQDFFRRRGEVELDYSKSLDKLAKSLQLRHKEQRQKREQWPMFSSYSCWQQLVNQTKSLSRDHAAMSEIYSTHLVARLQTVWDDVQRIYRKCREIGFETHVEILRILQELHTNMKTYHTLQTEAKEADKKLRAAENQRIKLQQSVPKEKLERSKKYRLIEKEVLKRRNKYTDARLRALKAKNEYQLCLEASNTTIHKYFVEDLSDLIDCMDLGFHSVVSRALLMHVSADQGRCRAVLHNAEALSHIVNLMDSRADKQKFLEQHSAAFRIPKRLEFQGQDEEVEPELQKALHQEMESRLLQLEQRVNNLRMESEEIWKTLETAEINLLDILNTKDYDCTSAFGDGAIAVQKSESISLKLRSDKNEIEEFYITKIREYILATSRIARLDSKAEYLRNALTKDSACKTDTLTKPNVPKRKRIGRINKSGRPKLFGGSLEEYLEVSGEEIPLILRSCIRVINLYGLHHQGIFRVSGSQVEISNFKEAFERGDDPLAEMTDASDINSVAGVLKLYLRELREPLFPLIYFDHFIQLAQLESKQEIVSGIRKFFYSLPKSVVVVIRYLFAFLNHLSEYSEENMMDAYNLAICFGPTLMPAPEDKDQVQYQNQVNELIKNIIVHHADLFQKDLGGMQYEKFITSETFEDMCPMIGGKERGEERDKSEHLKSSSSEESVRKRRPSGNISLNSQLSICTQNSNITCGSEYTTSTISATAGAQNTEPIYAEPTKVSINREKSPATDSGTSSTSNDEESDNVELRASLLGGIGEPPEHSKSTLGLNRRSESMLSSNTPSADDEPPKAMSADDQSDRSKSVRKYHSKSFSLSDNKLVLMGNVGGATPAGTFNVFQQNRDLWQKRATQSSYQSLTTSRILSRNRIAPDLVMDLPPSAITKEGPVHASRESIDNELEDMTSAERFAAQNQCTLKKNERFSNESPVYENNTVKKEVKLDGSSALAVDKPKAEVKPQELSIKSSSNSISSTEVQKIDEEHANKEATMIECGNTSLSAAPLTVAEVEEESPAAETSNPVTHKDVSKSPIPAHNTQKFVSQFADLHLTGGCLVKSSEGIACASVTSLTQEQQAKSLSSFKPQVKVKPQILKKPQVLPPQTPEMQRRNPNI